MSPALTVFSKIPEVDVVMSSNDFFFDSSVSADVPAANPVDDESFDLSCDKVEKKFIARLKSCRVDDNTNGRIGVMSLEFCCLLWCAVSGAVGCGVGC